VENLVTHCFFVRPAEMDGNHKVCGTEPFQERYRLGVGFFTTRHSRTGYSGLHDIGSFLIKILAELLCLQAFPPFSAGVM
jgi:hypothetical protein